MYWGCFSDLEKTSGVEKFGKVKGVFSELAENPTVTPGQTWVMKFLQRHQRASVAWECTKGPWVDTCGGSPQTAG